MRHSKGRCLDPRPSFLLVNYQLFGGFPELTESQQAIIHSSTLTTTPATLGVPSWLLGEGCVISTPTTFSNAEESHLFYGIY